MEIKKWNSWKVASIMLNEFLWVLQTLLYQHEIVTTYSEESSKKAGVKFENEKKEK